MPKNKKIIFEDLALIDYKKSWEYQEKIFDKIINQKLENRENNQDKATENHLLFCQHPHVYTMGKSGSTNNLLFDDNFLKKINARFYKINRGGDVTYHGEGQLVGYPIIDLENFDFTIKNYIRNLEEVIILTLAEYKIKGSRLENSTGVWLDVGNPFKVRKICAIGVRASRYVSMHGFALNINTNLDYFNHIIPCGIGNKGVTSMKNEIGKEINFKEVQDKVYKNFLKVFCL
ncbi:MAG: hypothetical protein B6I24_04035 [Bacteroidetes bacterium 4572_128]|nr:MAG: hypothetical protein B6I24_04035 [Bacteroidetes bacterium 4572_128]